MSFAIVLWDLDSCRPGCETGKQIVDRLEELCNRHDLPTTVAPINIAAYGSHLTTMNIQSKFPIREVFVDKLSEEQPIRPTPNDGIIQLDEVQFYRVRFRGNYLGGNLVEMAICERMETLAASPVFHSSILFLITGNEEMIVRALELFHRDKLVVISQEPPPAFQRHLDITSYRWDPATSTTSSKFNLQHLSGKMQKSQGELTTTTTTGGKRDQGSIAHQHFPLSSKSEEILTIATTYQPEPLPMRILLLYTAWAALIPFLIKTFEDGFNKTPDVPPPL